MATKKHLPKLSKREQQQMDDWSSGGYLRLVEGMQAYYGKPSRNDRSCLISYNPKNHRYIVIGLSRRRHR